MKSKVTRSISILLVILLISGFYMVHRTKTQVKELFRMNKDLQENGYYMAEFEFKMLGIAYDLDKGHYYTSLKLINQLHQQLKTKAGLIKVPVFQNKAEELEFYLNLQNPNTGAFMDDSYPYCTYTGPTGNVLLHLESLAAETGQPLQLKYPLKYLDKINSPENMKAYLNDVSTVEWIGAKFPQTSFHFARDVLSLFYENNTVVKHGLYNVAPETKEALLQWFYDNQDPETGLWGPKSKNGKLMKKDTMNTVSIMKVFVDEQGNNVNERFPLRYKDALIQSIIAELDKPLPPDDEFDEWHEWNLEASKSIKVLTRYLWNDISDTSKEQAKGFFEYYISLKFAKFYVPAEGSFSYYPYGEHATLDGTSDFFLFNDIGALSGTKQAQLWGLPAKTITDLGIQKVNELKQNDLSLIASSKSVNSLRVFKSTPDYENLTSGVLAVIYPRKPLVLDVVDLTPRVKRWAESTDQSMGNWVSKEDILKDLSVIGIEAAPAYIYGNDLPMEGFNEILKKNKRLVVIGYDILQVPCYKIVYEYDGLKT